METIEQKDIEQIQELVNLDKGSIPVEDFFQNPEQTAFQVSPKGDYIAYMAPYQKRMNVFVKPINGSEAIRVTSQTDRDIAGYFWADNDNLVYLKDSGGDENYHLFVAYKDGSHEKDLTPFGDVQAQIIDDLEDIDNEVIIGLNKNNPQLFEPYRLNLKTGELTQLAENTDPANPISSWVTDHDGKIRVAVRVLDGVNHELLYRDTEEEEWTVVRTTNFKESLNPLFFTFDNKNLYALTNLGRDKEAVVKLDVKTGEEVEVLYEHNEYDLSGLTYSHKRKVLTTIPYISWKRQRVFLDTFTENLFKRLEQELGDYEIVISSVDDAEENFIVRTYSDRSLGAYYLYNTIKDTLTKLAEVNDKLDENQMAEMKPITYTTRDGLTIHGYLSVPSGMEAKNLPVVVHPHGGPWVRDNWGFNPAIQFLCNRGYAVFQMNYRGSTGYGRQFWECSFKQWGKKMQDDITDGVNWLIDEGIANPNKVAIFGGSYGGYATLAGLTFTPDLYCCGMDYVGVSNLFTFLNTIPPYWKPYLAMMHEMVGHPETDKELLESSSPVFHVDKIKVPLFVIQGAKDPRVNIDESDQIVNALRARGINVPYMVKENEGHGFHNEENRFEAYKAMSGFLSQYIGG